jgi:hypothetical protein
VKADVELLHVIVDERDFVIRHEPGTIQNQISRSYSLYVRDYAHIFMTSVSIRRLGELCRQASHR